jgi:hypothetical protein
MLLSTNTYLMNTMVLWVYELSVSPINATTKQYIMPDTDERDR